MKLWLRELKEIYHNRCARCGAHESEKQLTIDHITPLSTGGINLKQNLTILCFKCNKLKGSRDPIEFFGEQLLVEILAKTHKAIEQNNKGRQDYIRLEMKKKRVG